MDENDTVDYLCEMTIRRIITVRNVSGEQESLAKSEFLANLESEPLKCGMYDFTDVTARKIENPQPKGQGE